MPNTCILTKRLPFEGSGSIQLVFNYLVFFSVPLSIFFSRQNIKNILKLLTNFFIIYVIASSCLF